MVLLPVAAGPVEAALTAAGRGTVETLAGPGFCRGSAMPDRLSGGVGPLAVDPDGTFYVRTGNPTWGQVAKVTPDGRVRRLMARVGGTGVAGRGSGSDPGTVLPLLADGSGGVITATATRIVDIAAGGSLRTIAGADVEGGPPGSSGDGGPAADARFQGIVALTADDRGNLLVADGIDRAGRAVRIRLIDRTPQPVTVFPGTAHPVSVTPGHIETIAGGGGDRPERDGDAALGATIVAPSSLAATTERLYVASDDVVGGTRVRMINLGGLPLRAHGITVAPRGIQTVAIGSPLSSGGVTPVIPVGGFSRLPGMAVGTRGQLYLADELHQRVRMIDEGGMVVTVAGHGPDGPDGGGFDGNGQPATAARLDRPIDVKVDAAGRVLIADSGNGEVRIVDQGGYIHAARGSGLLLASTCGRDAPPAGGTDQTRTGGPMGVAWDSTGNGYVAIADGRQIKQIAPDGNVTTIAGTGMPPSCSPAVPCTDHGGDGGSARRAQFATPVSLALTPRGDIYVLDAGTARVRFVNRGDGPVTVHGVVVQSGAVATVAGDGTAGDGGDGGPAVRAQLAGLGPLAAIPGSTKERMIAGDSRHGGDTPVPLGSLALDSRGELFISDPGNHRVRMVDAGGTIATVAGLGASGSRATCCGEPGGLAVDREDNLYIGDLETARVWVINRGTRPLVALGQTVMPGSVAPVAGNGTRGPSGGGGQALAAPLLDPLAMTVDRQGRLFMAEAAGSAADIMEVAGDGTIKLLVGTGHDDFDGDGRPGRLTSIGLVTGLAVDGCGNVVMAELGNDRVRRLDLSEPCGVGVLSAGGSAGGPVAASPGLFSSMMALLLVGVVGIGCGAVVAIWRRRRRRSG